MDYDDNDFQGQNHQLAGEGCSKVSPVLHPYTLPKFDFDDSLHAHLNFNSLAENNFFLGITNQEDNQWTEQYSPGNDDIDFNSSTVESRHNNVWSEATSSESVEMLLKSVGQEEKVVKETKIESLDNCNEPGSLTEVMDPNLKKDISGGVNSVALNEKHDLSGLEGKVENASDVVVQKEAEHMVNESMVDNLGSSENVGASNEELKIQENSQSVSVDVSGLSNNVSSGAAEQSIQNEENSMSFKSGPGEKKKSFVPNVESMEKLSAETSIPFSEYPDQVAPESNVGFLTNISLVKNSSSEEDETATGKDAVAVSANEKEDASLPVESGEMDIEVVQGHDTQKNVEPSLVLEKENKVIPYNLESEMPVPNQQVAITESAKRSFTDTTDGHATAEADDQPKSPIFGVSLVHQDNKEEVEVGFSREENSQNQILQVKSVVASVSNNPTLVEKEASHALDEKLAHGFDVHCVPPVENFDASQIEQNPETNNDSQERGNNSQIGGLQDPKESVIEASPSEINAKDKQEATKGVTHDSSMSSKIIFDAENKVGKATQEEKNFTFEVNKGAVLGQPGKSFQSYPTFQVSNHKIADGPSKDSSSSQLDAKKLHDVSLSPQNPSVLTSQIGVKGKSERKPRRKSTMKESAKKSNHPKEITPSRDSVRGKITAVSLTRPAVGHATHFEAIKSHENVAKPGVVLSSIKLPDLNNSTSIFQQPFTDNQQLQLRAQILVYGSLISGSPPEEPYMIAAFGQSDGERTWEGVWRACLERLHVQKSQSKSNIPVQPRSGNIADQRIIHSSPQNKITSSPIGAVANQGTPPTITPMIPLSLPLWKVSTASNNLQSSGMPKTARPDYHQPLSPLHPYQNSPMQNFGALNPSWLSQGPFAGKWVAASPIPAFNPTPHFPPLHINEPVKVTLVKESGGSDIKHTSSAMVQNSAPASSPEPSSNSKGRKRKKATPSLSPVPPYLPQNVEKVVMSEETLTKVEESKTQAEEANKHAANAASQCHEVWSLLERRCEYGPDDEAKLVSSAVSIAAAASVAKVAAAAAKIASDIADQARSMFNVFLSNKSQNLDQNSMIALGNGLDKATPDAIIKAAEMAAEAVSQAGKIVAMSEPVSLTDLVEAGPAGYWKTPQLASKQQAVLAAGNLNGTEKKNVESTTEVSVKGNPLTELGSSGKAYDGTAVPFTSYGKDKRKPRVRKGHEMSKSIGAVPESEIASAGTSDAGQTEPKFSSDTLNECNIKEGCLVEVYKDDDKTNGAWFGAKVLDLKDGKALVSYTEIQSDDGQLTAWVPLEVEGTEVPKIRVAHPVTTMRLEGTRKRRRTASTNFVWSSGDRVDVWIQDRWREGVVLETNKIDVTSLTVQFPAQGETSVVRSWFVRPTLVWKDGKWIECHTSDKRLSSQGDSPQEKRLKLGSPVVVSKKNQGSSESSDHVDPRKQEESNTLSLSNHETVFSVGSTRDNKKVASSRTVKSGLQKEGTRVVFGVPKPGKKQKFMDVSRHYVADVSNKKNTPHDSVKFTKYLIPQAPGSRGWKNNSKSDPIDKQAAGNKSRLVKSRRPPISTARPLTLPKSTTRENNSTNKMSTDSVSDSENQSGHQNPEIGSSSKSENAPGQSNLVSSLSIPEEPQMGVSAKPERLKKGKIAPTGGNAAKVEKSLPEVVETRRSNRKMQPTSRLLESLQTSMTNSKLPAASHSTPRSQSKVTPKGSTNNA